MTITYETVTLTGNEAVAWAMKLARVQAGLFFPMGPADEVMETVRIRIDSGEMPNTRIIQTENEKSAVSCQIGLARMGIRSLFATCDEGLLWPSAEIRLASGWRLPMMIAVPSRGIEPPNTVYPDHEDFIMQRDMNWLMFYCEDSQDIFDTIIQAYKISEHRSVFLPAFVGYDGWEISHGKSRVIIPEQAKIDTFLPPYPREKKDDYSKVDWHDRFKSRRNISLKFGTEQHMELKLLQVKALEEALDVIDGVGKEYQELFGSNHVGFLETEGCEGAEIILLTMGVLAPLVRLIAGAYREQGVKVGTVKLRVFRPFPNKALQKIMENTKLVIVIERNCRNAIYTELKAAMYDQYLNKNNNVPPPMVMAKIVGIGGRCVSPKDISTIIDDGIQALKIGRVKKDIEWIGVSEINYEPLTDDIVD